jgi:predicted nucleic acid-binding protein
MSAEGAVYLDSSAIVKLVIAEAESAALGEHLSRATALVSCTLARVEVVRAVAAHGSSAVRRARSVLGSVALIQLDEALLDEAAELGKSRLRSLDAIHLAAAAALRADLAEVITYDPRMADAARALHFTVAAPA